MNNIIHQVHEEEGVYEDYTDIIRGTFLDVENAKAFMEKLKKDYEKQNADAIRCRECDEKGDMSSRKCYKKLEGDEDGDCENYRFIIETPSWYIKAETINDFVEEETYPTADAIYFAGEMESYLNIPSCVCETIERKLVNGKANEVIDFVIKRRREITQKERTDEEQ